MERSARRASVTRASCKRASAESAFARDDLAVRVAAAKAWSGWEAATVTLLPSPEVMEEFTEDDKAVAVARIENHYFRIPGIIVQGRHDCCTPPVAAWRLKQAWPEVELQIVPDASHLYSEPGITDGLVRATDRFAAKA